MTRIPEEAVEAAWLVISMNHPDQSDLPRQVAFDALAAALPMLPREGVVEELWILRDKHGDVVDTFSSKEEAERSKGGLWEGDVLEMWVRTPALRTGGNSNG
jgi:hypothetical protein